MRDTIFFLSYLQQRNPFQIDEDDNSLWCIETGVTADSAVNVEQAKEIGSRTLQDMIGKNVKDYSFRKSQQAVTLNEKSSLKVNGEVIAVDPQLLFQRLTAAANRYVTDISEVFNYELSGVPSSLFDNTGLMREPQKSALAQAIWSHGDCSLDEDYQPEQTINHVIDGGSLLQRIPWEKGSTFGISAISTMNISVKSLQIASLSLMDMLQDLVPRMPLISDEVVERQEQMSSLDSIHRSKPKKKCS